tara:strand:- start:1882 stop:2079 length:198 start_codon:yes stop_codon:yes gene_type:complete
MKKQERTKLIDDLNTIDKRLKFSSTTWNAEVKNAFNQSGSFDFQALVSTSPNTSRKLVENFKLVR